MKRTIIYPLLVTIYLIGLPGCKSPSPEAIYDYPFQNPNLPVDERVGDLISQLTIDEKIALMTHDADSVSRLGIPYYNWWNEALHGVARSAPATVFPQAIGMAATFDEKLIYQVADAISDEARALYHASVNKGVHKQYLGLTFFSPNINIFRDPRWGRGHETYGEDPYLTGLLGKAFVKGLQGDDDKYYKVTGCAKHFAVHNGPESKRHYINTIASKKDLYETYLPAFQDLIDANVAGVMCAYDQTNDMSCCGSSAFLVDLLRNEMKFDGYIVSDCGALHNLHSKHNVSSSPEESAAIAIKNSINVNCGDIYKRLPLALQKGFVTEKEINMTLAKQLEIRFKLGMFDPDDMVKYSKINEDIVRCKKHIDLTREVAQKSIVLLKNKNNILPLNKDITQLYLMGNNMADVNALMGNYYGSSGDYVTLLEGIANKVSKTTIVRFDQGILLDQDLDELKLGQVWNAPAADVTIAAIGLSALYEGENGDTPFSKTGGDRDKIELPEGQLKFLQELRKACGEKPLVVVVFAGSAIAMPEVHELADAILWVWYPGEQGGNAIADVIFGNVSPSGRLPVTMYNSTDQLGDYEDYNISEGGRTYRYFKDAVLYPFGFGLGYSKIEYASTNNETINMAKDENIELEVELSNVGEYAQDEVVQLYISKTDAEFPTPIYALKSIKRVSLNPDESKKISFTITSKMLHQINNEGKSVLLDGEYKVWIGGSSPSSRAIDLGASKYIEYSIFIDNV